MSNYSELKVEPGKVLTREKWNGLVVRVEERDQEILEALTIKPDKSIGIGTTTPAVALDVEGSIRLGDRPGGGNNLYLTNQIKDHHYIGVKSWWTEFVSHPNEGWNFKTKSNALPVLKVEGKTGNVGIGTSTPNAKLVVGSNFGASVSGSGNGHAVFGTNLAVYQGGANASKLYTPYSHGGKYGYAGMHLHWGTVDFYTSKVNTVANRVVTPVPALRIIKNLVGVNTTDPKSSLHVKGNAGILNLEGKDHGYIQFYPDTFGKGRKAWLGFGNATTETFTIRNAFRHGKIDLHGELIFRTLTSRRDIPEFQKNAVKYDLKFKIDARKLSFGYGEIHGKSIPLAWGGGSREFPVKKKGLMVFLDGKLINFFESDESHFAGLQP